MHHTAKEIQCKEYMDSRGVKPYQRNHQLVFKSTLPRHWDTSTNELYTTQPQNFVKEYTDSVLPYITEHKVENLKDLTDQLESIGNWIMLCTSLKVDVGIIDELRHSPDNVSIKKWSCLNQYYNSGHATWEEIIAVIRGPNFHNERLAKSIAEKYNIYLSE